MDVMNEETMKARAQTDGPSVNKEVERVVEGVIRDAQALRVDVSQGPLGETRIDCGVRAVGGLEAGRRMGEICLGGLGRVTLETTDTVILLAVQRDRAHEPAGACLPRLAICRLEPFGRGQGQEIPRARIWPRARPRLSGKAVRRARLPGQGRSRLPGARSRPRSSGRPGRACRQGLQGFDRRPHHRLRADVEPRRHGADRRALPRGRAAQGA